MIKAGFGKLALFKDVQEQHITDSFKVNTISVLRLIKRFYGKLEGKEDFYCGVMDGIAGWMSSPFFCRVRSHQSCVENFYRKRKCGIAEVCFTKCDSK